MLDQGRGRGAGPNPRTRRLLARAVMVAMSMVLAFAIAPAILSAGAGTSASENSGLVPSYVVGVVAPTPSQPTADIGQPITFTSSGFGGIGPYTFSWTADPNLGCGASTTDTISCTPTNDLGPYFISVQACDSGAICSAVVGVPYTVYSDPVVTDPTPSVTAMDVNQLSMFWSTSPSGGSGGYSYSWSQSDPLEGCAYFNLGALTCNPTGAGTFYASVFVTDSNGMASGTHTATTALVVSPELVTTTPTVSPPTIDLGQSVVFTTTTSGGLTPYSWTWLGSFKLIPCGVVDTATTSTLTCTPSGTGNLALFVKVTDANSNMIDSPSVAVQVFTDPSTTVPTPSQPSADVGQTVTFSTTPSAGDGFYSTFTWAESSGFLGCTLLNAAAIPCTPTATGSYQTDVKVTDTNGATSAVETSASFIVYPDPTTTTPTNTLPVPSQPSADVGQLVKFSTTTTGGLSPYSYVWHGLPTGCSTANADPLSCTPSGTGTFSVYVVMTDTNNFVVTSGTYTFTVYSTPTTTDPVANHASIDLTQPVTFSTISSGGLTPYSYVWHNLPTGCVTVDAASLTCTPTGTGTFSVYVVFTDQNNYQITTGHLLFTVYPDPTVATPVPSHPGADLGEQVWFTAATTGGAPPLSFVWHGLPSGCSTSNHDPLSCTPKGAGTFHVYVVVTDANLWQVTSGSLTFVVVQALDIHTPKVNHNPAEVGDTVTFSVQASSMGMAPYTYSWNGLPGGCVSANSVSITCTLTVPTGTFHISVTTTDANGAVKTSASLKFTLQALD